MELRQYWKIIKKRFWLIVLLMVVSASSAAYYGRQQVPLYSTTATLLLNPAAPSAVLPYQTTQPVQSLANTYSELMRTRSFASLVVQEMESPMSEGEILGALSTRYVPDTQFYKISATHADPQKAQALANAAAQVLIAENIAQQQAQRQQIEAQRDPAKLLERQRLAELQETLQDELVYYGDRIANLQAQIAELESKPPSEEIDQRILNLREELIRNQSLRIEVLSSLVGTQTALASDSGNTSSVDTAVVVDVAPLPTVSLPLRIPQYILFALAASLGLGVGLAFLLEYLDYTIKTPEELDDVYGLGTLGVIGAIKGGREGVDHEQIVTLTDPRSSIAEAFRALRTNIRFASPDEPVRSLLVTSAGPFEGKTLTAANLAVSLAQGGNRVILVDADLRKPRVHRLFGLRKAPGLSNLIIDQVGDDTDGYLQHTEVENLRVLTCGILPPNPAELLNSPRAGQVMEQLQAQADIVIYDSPPVATVTDAVILATRVDGVLPVVRAGSTRRDMVRQGKMVLEKVNARILGPVLNGVSLSDLGYYSYYYYYYYGDGHEPEKRSGLRRLLPWRQRRKRRRSEKVTEPADDANSSASSGEG
ncbi:MAG: polysaccharide biosynthesis tyrosine autokinase [Chloroflexi bacterium]|nr:polysaccharide biosynthesis tyrosine autokinase [Chloroflexota bacterium]